MAEKMLGTLSRKGSDGATESSPTDSDSLFEEQWEVFVIRRDESGHLKWFTLCCEASSDA